MDDYLKQYREMISLRGLTDHTLTAYSTYISAYLGYLSDILGKSPEEVSWAELRDFIRKLHRLLLCQPAHIFRALYRIQYGTHYSLTLLFSVY